MKKALGRYLVPFFVLLGIQLVIVFAVIIKAFGYPGGQGEAGGFFDFIADWSVVLSAVIVALVVLMFLDKLRKIRRGRALAGLHDWASAAVIELAQYRQEMADRDARAGRYENVSWMLEELADNRRTIVSYARAVGGSLGIRIRNTVDSIIDLRQKADRGDCTLFDDLQPLQHMLADIMIHAFESMPHRP